MRSEPVVRRARGNIAETVPAKPATWNSLEIAKLIVGILTPLTVAIVGFLWSADVTDRDKDEKAAAAFVAQINARRSALNRLGEAHAQLRARASILLFTLDLNRQLAKPDTEDIKAHLDRYYTSLVGVQSAAASFLDAAVTDPASGVAEQEIVATLFRATIGPFADCVADAYWETATKSKTAGASIERCQHPTAYTGRLTCERTAMTALGEIMYGVGAPTFEGQRATVKKACPPDPSETPGKSAIYEGMR